MELLQAHIRQQTGLPSIPHWFGSEEVESKALPAWELVAPGAAPRWALAARLPSTAHHLVQLLEPVPSRLPSSAASLAAQSVTNEERLLWQVTVEIL